MKNIGAILWKQLGDTLKNKTILIQFVMFPLLTIIMENSIKIENMPEHFFATLFSVMYIGMAPLTSMAAIISEEKEKNTLRVLLFSNVKPYEYLLGIGIYVWTICQLGVGVIAIAGGYKGKEIVLFTAIAAIGNVISTLLGALIGMMSKGQMMATSISIPVMMVFSFLPMLSMFNETIKKVGKIAYTSQINMLLQSIGDINIHIEQILVFGITGIVTLSLFILAYKKGGL